MNRYPLFRQHRLPLCESRFIFTVHGDSSTPFFQDCCQYLWIINQKRTRGTSHEDLYTGASLVSLDPGKLINILRSSTNEECKINPCLLSSTAHLVASLQMSVKVGIGHFGKIAVHQAQRCCSVDKSSLCSSQARESEPDCQ